MFNSKGMRKRERGEDREIDGNSTRQVYLQLWAIMMYRSWCMYRVTKHRIRALRSCHIDLSYKELMSVAMLMCMYAYSNVYIICTTSVLASITFAFTWDWLRHFDRSGSKARDVGTFSCLQFNGNASDWYRGSRYIETSKQQFNHGTSADGIVFDIQAKLLISTTCHIQKARFKR